MKSSGHSGDSEKKRLLIELAIGLTWQPLPAHINVQALNNQNLLTLSLLDVLEEQPATQHESRTGSSEFKHIDAKLNLLLHLVAQLLGHDRHPPEPVNVNLSVQDIEWLSESEPERDQMLLLDIYLDTEYQHALRLVAQVQALESTTAGYRVHAVFTSLNEAVREQLEKWIFRCHRRAIAQERGTR